MESVVSRLVRPLTAQASHVINRYGLISSTTSPPARSFHRSSACLKSDEKDDPKNAAASVDQVDLKKASCSDDTKVKTIVESIMGLKIGEIEALNHFLKLAVKKELKQQQLRKNQQEASDFEPKVDAKTEDADRVEPKNASGAELTETKCAKPEKSGSTKLKAFSSAESKKTHDADLNETDCAKSERESGFVTKETSNIKLKVPSGADSKDIKNAKIKDASSAEPKYAGGGALKENTYAKSDRTSSATSKNNSGAEQKDIFGGDLKITKDTEPKFIGDAKTKTTSNAKSKYTGSAELKGSANHAELNKAGSKEPEKTCGALPNNTSIAKPEVAGVAEPNDAKPKLNSVAKTNTAGGAKPKSTNNAETKGTSCAEAKDAGGATLKDIRRVKSEKTSNATSKGTSGADLKDTSGTTRKFTGSAVPKVTSDTELKNASNAVPKRTSNPDSKTSICTESKIISKAKTKVTSTAESKDASATRLKETNPAKPKKTTKGALPKVTSKPEIPDIAKPNITGGVISKGSSCVKAKAINCAELKRFNESELRTKVILDDGHAAKKSKGKDRKTPLKKDSLETAKTKPIEPGSTIKNEALRTKFQSKNSSLEENQICFQELKQEISQYSATESKESKLNSKKNTKGSNSNIFEVNVSPSLQNVDKVDKPNEVARSSLNCKEFKLRLKNNCQPSSSKSFITKQVVADIKAIKKNRKQSIKTASGEKLDKKPETFEFPKQLAAYFLYEPLDTSKEDKNILKNNKIITKNDSKEKAVQAVANFKNARRRNKLFIIGDSKIHENSKTVATPTRYSPNEASAQYKTESFIEKSKVPNDESKSKDKAVKSSQVAVGLHKSEKRSLNSELQQADKNEFFKPFFRAIKASYFSKNTASKKDPPQIKEASQSSVDLQKDALKHKARQVLSDSELSKKSKQVNEKKIKKYPKELYNDDKELIKFKSDGSSTKKSFKRSWAKQIAADIKQLKQKRLVIVENKNKESLAFVGSKERKNSSQTNLDRQTKVDTSLNKEKQIESLKHKNKEIAISAGRNSKRSESLGNESKETKISTDLKDGTNFSEICLDKQTTNTKPVKEKQTGSSENKSKQKMIYTDIKEEEGSLKTPADNHTITDDKQMKEKRIKSLVNKSKETKLSSQIKNRKSFFKNPSTKQSIANAKSYTEKQRGLSNKKSKKITTFQRSDEEKSSFLKASSSEKTGLTSETTSKQDSKRSVIGKEITLKGTSAINSDFRKSSKRIDQRKTSPLEKAVVKESFSVQLKLSDAKSWKKVLAAAKASIKDVKQAELMRMIILAKTTTRVLKTNLTLEESKRIKGAIESAGGEVEIVSSVSKSISKQ